MCIFSANKDAFNAFDKKGEGQIKVGDISAAMKKVGHTIKPEFLEKWEDDIDSEGTNITLFPCSSSWAEYKNITLFTNFYPSFRKRYTHYTVFETLTLLAKKVQMLHSSPLPMSIRHISVRFYVCETTRRASAALL